jgi:hypothetical protein
MSLSTETAIRVRRGAMIVNGERGRALVTLKMERQLPISEDEPDTLETHELTLAMQPQEVQDLIRALQLLV